VPTNGSARSASAPAAAALCKTLNATNIAKNRLSALKTRFTSRIFAPGVNGQKMPEREDYRICRESNKHTRQRLRPATPHRIVCSEYNASERLATLLTLRTIEVVVLPHRISGLIALDDLQTAQVVGVDHLGELGAIGIDELRCGR
jgi:hypothetical protein